MLGSRRQAGQGSQALAAAVEHRRQALLLSKNQSAFRQLLGEHMVDLARIDLKLGDYENAARVALDLPKTVPKKLSQYCYAA